MLEDQEWSVVGPLYMEGIREIKQYRATHGVTIAEAKLNGCGSRALHAYFDFTGYRETNLDVLWHHHLSFYGPPCPSCGNLLRSPNATFCAACGRPRQD